MAIGKDLACREKTTGGRKFVLTLALTFYPLPQERKSPLADSGFADDRPANPALDFSKDAGNVSPSPPTELGDSNTPFTRYLRTENELVRVG
jgi:hypothetical protein